MRQYIGARYVPKFMGTYDATQTYEALCVVDNGMGTSYISKVPTPANTPLTDTDYWAIYGASSGAIINLQNQIDTINNTTIPNLDNKYDGIIGDLNDLNVPANTVVDALNNVTKPKYVFITDSYGDPVATGGANTIITEFRTALGLVENDDITSIYQGGAGFVADGVKTFENLLNTVIARFTGGTLNFTADEVTHLIVVGGDNDNAVSTNPLVLAIGSFITAAKTAFPNAKIYVGEVGNVSNNQTVHLAIAKTVLPAYQRCTEYGGLYLSGVEKVMLHDSMFTVDGIHPTSAYGAKVMAIAIIEALNGCHTMSYASDGDMTTIGNDLGSTTGTIHAWGYTDCESTTIMLNGSVNTDGRALSQFVSYTLGTLPGNFGYVHGGGTYGYSQSEVTLNFGSEGINEALLYVDGKDIKLMPYKAMSPSGLQAVTATIKFPTQFN